MFLQTLTSLLDLAGILLLGLVGALAVTTVQSQPPPEAVERIAGLLGLRALSDQELVAVFAALAAVVLLSKSIISPLLTRRVFAFLANRQALVAARLTKELLSRPLTFVQQRSSQETAYALIQGAGNATLFILGSLVIVVTEIALLVLVGLALLFLDPMVTVGATAFFALVAILLQRAMGRWASRLGSMMAQADIASLNTIQEVMGTYREVTVSHRRDLYVQRFQDLRWRSAKVTADRMFIQQFPKYMFEAALVVGAFALAGTLFSSLDSVAAMGTLALFLAAGTRVMPSLLRLQGAALTLRESAAAAAPTFDLAKDLGKPNEDMHGTKVADVIAGLMNATHTNMDPRIELTGVTFTYPGASSPSVTNVSLRVPSGSSLALVGPSGAGKSTLADIMLGLINPDVGVATISGSDASEALVLWPGAIAYVPQEVAVAGGSVRSNVALGLPDELIDDSLVEEALKQAHLWRFLSTSAEGIFTQVGERGLRLSGGQRQRLGIARALYTRPRLIILDEATSALDADTEESITQTIQSLGPNITTVVIAHRLSTVRAVDALAYLERGRIVARGTFDELKESIPTFARQAHLLGL